MPNRDAMKSFLPIRTIALAALSMSMVACSVPQAGTASQASVPATPPSQEPASQLSRHTSSSELLAGETLDAVVHALLLTRYPEGFDIAHGCWKAHYGRGDDAMAYCMRPLPANVVTESGRRVIYVATASTTDIEGNPEYSYGATDAGVFDAFRAAVTADGNASITHAGTGMGFGTVGDCGCASADFVALGPDVHGWVFSSGGTWQGVTVSTHALVAPIGDTFKDVADIPQYVEEDQHIEYRIAIADARGTSTWFPLIVSKYRNARKLGERTVPFDEARGLYAFSEPC